MSPERTSAGATRRGLDALSGLRPVLSDSGGRPKIPAPEWHACCILFQHTTGEQNMLKITALTENRKRIMVLTLLSFIALM